MDHFSKVNLHTGNEMPVLGLGTWQLTIDTAESVLYALQQAYRLIDTSSDYGTQPGIGEAIKRSTVGRDQLFLVTKVEETDDAYERTKLNLDELKLEYVDLMLIHRPPDEGSGEELWTGLIRAKQEGLIKDIGVSNYSIELIEALIQASGEVPVVNQIEWSPFGYSEEMERYCKDRGIIIQAYSPLTRTKRLKDESLNEIAEKYQKSSAQVLIRWNLQRGSVPLPKANQREHIEENIQVFDFQISDEDMKRLNELNTEYSSLGELPYV